VAVATRPRAPRSEVPINLLPPQMRTQQRVQRAFRYAVTGAVALGVLLIAITVLQRMKISDAENDLREQRSQAASLQQRVSDLRQFEVMEQTANTNRNYLAASLRNDVSWSRFLDDLDTSIPADAWVTGLTMAAKVGSTPMGDTALGTVQYQGFVKSFPGLSGWLNTMESLDGLRFVYLSNGSKQDLGGTKVVNFSATANLTDSMLSGRCQKEGAPCP
jgi:Tfp pilus assembly protein PilN